MTFDDIASEIHKLDAKVNKAIEDGDTKRELDLKRELYKLKIAAIDILQGDVHDGKIMTARQLIERSESMGKLMRYYTGVKELDARKTLDGIEEGSYVQIAGPSGVGKTTLAMEILANVSEGHKTMLFSYEMGLRRSAKRLKKILKGKALDNLKVMLENDDVRDICSTIRAEAQSGTKFFVIDSRMKITASDYEGSEVQRFSYISNEISKAARDTGSVVIMINQISDESEKTGRLAIKYGGDQIYDSDIVLFLRELDSGEREIICTKNRTGEENLFAVIWDYETAPTYEEVVYDMPEAV